VKTLRPQTENAILVVEDAAFASILRRQRDDGDFSRYDLRRTSERRPRFAAAYYAECFRTYGLSPAFAERLKPYLAPAFLAEEPKGDARLWQTIARHLIEKGIMRMPAKLQRPVELVNDPDLEPCMTASAAHVLVCEPATTPFSYLQAPDERTQLRFAVQLAAKWLEEGTKPGEIVIANVREEDRFLLSTLSRRYGFSLAFPRRTPLIQLTSVAKFWLRLDREDPFAALDAAFPDAADPIRAELLEILELYRDFPDAATFWRFELERRTADDPGIAGAVRIASWEELNVFDDARTIVLNVGEGMFPTLRQDDGLVSDEELPSLGMRPSIAENQRRRQHVKRVVETLPDLVLIAPAKRRGSLVANLDLGRFNRPFAAVTPNDEWLARSLDDARFLRGALAFEKRTYGVESKTLARLDASLPEARRYDPRFKGIEPSTNARLRKKPFVLSASSLETFYSCRFRYLLAHLLKMEPTVPVFSASLGTAVHRRLEKHNDPSIPIELSGSEYGPERLRTFEIAVDRRLDRVVARLLEHLAQTPFTDAGTEKVVEIPIENREGYRLKGRIDRIMTTRLDDRDYVAVIDYKTSNQSFSLDDFAQGTDLQLIVYWELLRKQPQFADAALAGFFYQPVVLNRLNEADGSDDFAKRMRMNGYVLDRTDVAKAFDSGGFVRGLQFKQDGTFHSRVKRFDEERLDGLLKQLQIHLQRAVDQIEQGDFRITPIAKKPGASESVSCQYCPFAGICYQANQSFDGENDEIAGEEAEEWAE
jgi:hypothetical protein